MGWGSGTELFGRVMDVLKKEVKDDKKRQKIYVGLIDAFEDNDWDNACELLGEDPAFDAACKELHPHWNEDDEDE